MQRLFIVRGLELLRARIYKLMQKGRGDGGVKQTLKPQLLHIWLFYYEAFISNFLFRYVILAKYT